jgi:L-ascorbate metabolism protein UlaG (beta-lactamase superfamily)
VARSIRAADAIVVGHSHFDHAVDVPLIAARTGAPVWGSTSTANLLRAWGLDEAQIVECDGGEVLEVGPFRVELVPSEHSRFALGAGVPYAGDIPCSCELPLRGRDYRCGQVFGIFIQVGGLSIYHCGSANLIDDAIPAQASEVDLLVMCLAARHVTERFIPRMLARTRPRLLLPSHYDNFFRRTSRRMQLLPLIQFGRFVDEVEQLDRDIRIVTLPFDGVMRLGSG